MKLGAIVAVAVTAVGLGAVVFAFTSNASPYVTVAEAKQRPGDNQYLSGDIIAGSLETDLNAGLVRFAIKDKEGQQCNIVYHGTPPNNMSHATKVVAVGGIKNGAFHSTKLLLKCPSKYESEK